MNLTSADTCRCVATTHQRYPNFKWSPLLKISEQLSPIYDIQVSNGHYFYEDENKSMEISVMDHKPSNIFWHEELHIQIIMDAIYIDRDVYVNIQRTNI